MQTSARNRLPEAATDLGLKAGMRVSALVKATSVMVVRDDNGENAD